MSEEKALIVVEPASIAKIFKPQGADPILEEIKKMVDDFEPDISTATGRKKVASFARKIASSKVYLDAHGKKLNAGLKSQTKAVDSERKRVRDMLDELRDKARKPLTNWENAEKERKATHQVKIDHIRTFEEAWKVGQDSEFLEKQLVQLRGIVIDENYEEFESQARELQDSILPKLKEALRMAREREEIDKEKARIKFENEERERKARDERIKKKAAEEAKEKAEKKAQDERDELKEKETRAKIEKDRLAEQLKDEQQKKLYRILDYDRDFASSELTKNAISEVEKIKVDGSFGKLEEAANEAKTNIIEKLTGKLRIQEEQERKDEAERAKKEHEKAAKAERQRIADEEDAKKKDDEKRAADKDHVNKIDFAAVSGLIDAGFDASTARKLILTVKLGKAPNMFIKY